VAAAAGGAGRLFGRLTAAAFADETAGRHELADFLAAAAAALGLGAADDQAFEVLAAGFAMVFVNRHINGSPRELNGTPKAHLWPGGGKKHPPPGRKIKIAIKF
jgi:hypothetical protein